jgi:hypothetical protein
MKARWVQRIILFFPYYDGIGQSKSLALHQKNSVGWK